MGRAAKVTVSEVKLLQQVHAILELEGLAILDISRVPLNVKLAIRIILTQRKISPYLSIQPFTIPFSVVVISIG